MCTHRTWWKILISEIWDLNEINNFWEEDFSICYKSFPKNSWSNTLKFFSLKIFAYFLLLLLPICEIFYRVNIKEQKKSFQDVAECWFIREKYSHGKESIASNFPSISLAAAWETNFYLSKVMLAVNKKHRLCERVFHQFWFRYLRLITFFLKQILVDRWICLPSIVVLNNRRTNKTGEEWNNEKNVYQGIRIEIEIGQGHQAAKLLYTRSFLLCTSRYREKYSQWLWLLLMSQHVVVLISWKICCCNFWSVYFYIDSVSHSHCIEMSFVLKDLNEIFFIS